MVAAAGDVVQCRIVSPVIKIPLSLCLSDHLPLSEPAAAVKDILLELAADLALDVAPRRPGRRYISAPYRYKAKPSWRNFYAPDTLSPSSIAKLPSGAAIQARGTRRVPNG